MYDHLHAKIEVDARFLPGGKVDIHSFTWKDRDYEVQKVNLVTRAHKGRDTVWMFHVSTATEAFKLRFDTDTLCWWLIEVTWTEQDNKP